MDKTHKLGVQTSFVFRARLRYEKDISSVRIVKIHNLIVVLGRREMGEPSEVELTGSERMLHLSPASACETKTTSPVSI